MSKVKSQKLEVEVLMLKVAREGLSYLSLLLPKK